MHIHFLDTTNDTVKSENDTVKSSSDTVNDTVFSLIRQDNKITATEISKRLNVSLSTVRRRIKELKAQNLIARMGSDKAGYWKINQK